MSWSNTLKYKDYLFIPFDNDTENFLEKWKEEFNSTINQNTIALIPGYVPLYMEDINIIKNYFNTTYLTYSAFIELLAGIEGEPFSKSIEHSIKDYLTRLSIIYIVCIPEDKYEFFKFACNLKSIPIEEDNNWRFFNE